LVDLAQTTPTPSETSPLPAATPITSRSDAGVLGPADHFSCAAGRHGVEELASFVLRVEDRTAWCSPATARWLTFDNVGAQAVRPGSVVVITEGPVRVVAYFHVTEVLKER
ncbi:hypothetical protein, partial [Nocardia aurea]